MAGDVQTATVGVNVSGAEYSWMPFVGTSDLDYLASQGVTLIRLPISWEKMQPTLNGPLDSAYLAGLENVLSAAAARGIQVIIDLHNYGRYDLNYAAEAAANYGITSSTNPDAAVIGSAEVPVSAFANFWSALAGHLNGHAGLAGYDIMNEPYNMGSTTIWPQAAQAAVNAIRTVDMSTPIYVEGYQWAGAANWLANNANLHITDPANKIIYEAHAYFDSNGSGQYAQTYAQQGANPNTGVQDLQPFLDWLKANNYQGFVGELGVPGNDPNWNTVLDNALAALQAAGVSSTVWNYVYADPSGKNSWWPVADSMSIDPNMGWGGATMETIVSHAAILLTVPSIAGFSPDSNVVGDGITNVNHLTLTGTATAGGTVQVFDGATQIGTATANGSGAWSFATATLTDGSHAFTSKAVDTAGNVSAASAALNVTIDTSAPGAPTVATFSTDSGVAGDGITNDNTLTLTGTAAAGSTVEVFDGATQIGTATANGSGAWSFATATLTDGSHTFISKAVDVAGNVSAASAALNVTIDTSAPGAPTVATFSTDSGVIGDGITNDNTLTLTGTAVAGSTVQVFDGATQIGTATVNGSGAWSFATATLTEGNHAFTSKAVDVAGNVSAASPVLNVIIDTIAPGAPTLASFSTDSGVVGDGITNDNTLTLTGTAAAGGTVRVFDGATQIGTATANGSGAWSFATATLTDGSHAFTSKAVDAAGNVSAASAALNVTIDTAAPGAPTVATFSTDSGVAGDGITNDNTLTLTGTAAAGSTVQVFDGATQIGTATANGSGAWSLVTATLTDGSHAFTSKAVDVAGNVSAASSALNVTIDTAAPGAPTVATFSTDSGVAGDGITSDNTLTLTGTAAAGSTVQVFDGATQIGTATANGSGAWSFATAALTDGSHAFTGKAVDAAGNVSAASAALNVTIDTAAPGAPTVVTFSTDSGVAGDGITNDNTLTLTGTAAAGSTVRVFDGATQIGTAIANGSGAWSFATATLTEGNHAFTSKALDAAGNVSAPSSALNVTIDTIAPAAPTVAVNHDVMTGTAEAGSTVLVLDGTEQIGTTTANGSGFWSLSVDVTVDISHSYSANAMDSAGNVSASSTVVHAMVISSGGLIPSVPSTNSGTTAGEGLGSPGSMTDPDTTELFKFDHAVSLWGSLLNLIGAKADFNYDHPELPANLHDYAHSALGMWGGESAASHLISPPSGDSFRFAFNLEQRSGPTVPGATIDTSNQAFVFENEVSPIKSAPEGPLSNMIGSLIALAHDTQPDSQWMHTVHDLAIGDPGNVSPMNAHLVALHDFMVH